MKKILFINIITILFGINLNAQEYYNKIIPFEFGNPTPAHLFLLDQFYYIPVIYFSQDGDISTIIKFNSNTDNYKYLHFNNFVFAKESIVNINDDIYIYAKDRSIQNDLRLRRLNPDMSTSWLNNYNTNGEYNFPMNSIKVDKYIYISFLDDYNNGKHREIGIKKIDTLGNEIWSKNFNIDKKLSYAWEILPTFDNNILISTGVNYNNKIGRYSQLTKIDTAGNILWRTEGNEEFEDGAIPNWIAQLSDSSIVESYKIDKWGDLEFIKNNWSFYPTRLKWYDKNGLPTHESLVIIPKEDELYFNQIEAGKGDYFFAYGMYVDDDTLADSHNYSYHGLIIKYTNAGDTVWVRKYQNNSMDSTNVAFSINDIEELDNGDIVAMGIIRKTGENGRIWLFKVNSEGCFGEDSCGVYQRTIVHEIEKSVVDLYVFPNPASDIITVNLPHIGMWENWTLYDISGKQVRKGVIDKRLDFTITNLSNLNSGIYFLKVFDKKGKIGIGKFVVD